MMRRPITYVLASILSATVLSCGDQQGEPGERVDPPALDAGLQSDLEAWLRDNGTPPIDYVVGLFADHDVVFLGEQHRIKHDVELVAALLEPLHRAGVHALATEFGRREDQPLIDSLLALPAWDEALARSIVFNQLVTWGYQEYVDIYRAAWQLNRDRDPDAAPFGVLALGDSPDWRHVRTPEDRDDPEVMRKVWRGGGERFWAEVILEAVERGEKVLVHCGIHHAFTEYKQPIVIDGAFVRHEETRAGNYVYRAIGKQAVTVFLHAPWNGPGGYGDALVHPADGIIDALMLNRPGGPVPVGFDLSGSPFGELRVEGAVYRHGYEDFRLGQFADGWIYTKPISEYEGVTPIPGWIDETNIDVTRQQVPNPEFRDAAIERFNDGIARDAEIPRRFGHLR